MTFDAAKDRPLTIGYGLAGSAPATVPSQPPRWKVGRVVGAPEAGYVDAAREDARFDRPYGLIGSKLSSKTLFVADGGNHRIRKIIATTTFETQPHAGGAAAGWVDGGAVARFRRPTGSPSTRDDTLYVTDADDHRIRVVAPDGTVST